MAHARAARIAAPLAVKSGHRSSRRRDTDAGRAGVGGRCDEQPTRAGLGIDQPFTSKPHAQGGNIAFDAFAVAVIVFNQFVNQLDLSRADSSHRPISLAMSSNA